MMNNIKAIIKDKLLPFVRRHRVLFGGAGMVLLGLVTWSTFSFSEADPIIDVPTDSVTVVVQTLTEPLVLPPAGDTTINISKKIASMKNDSAKISQDSQRDRNMEKSCDELLAEYKKVIEELIASDYSSEAYTKYTTFGMIKDENGMMRLGPKLASCKQDPVYMKAFDEIDKKLINGN